jgi:hypothetical protein
MVRRSIFVQEREIVSEAVHGGSFMEITVIGIDPGKNVFPSGWAGSAWSMEKWKPHDPPARAIELPFMEGAQARPQWRASPPSLSRFLSVVTTLQARSICTWHAMCSKHHSAVCGIANRTKRACSNRTQTIRLASAGRDEHRVSRAGNFRRNLQHYAQLNN